MSAQHTPGPWVAHGHYVYAVSVGTVARAEWFSPKKADTETRRANARLIAAAPDLFAALRLLVSTASTQPLDVKRLMAGFNAARAAIAKAEGR